jgi:hypothetical protein
MLDISKAKTTFIRFSSEYLKSWVIDCFHLCYIQELVDIFEDVLMMTLTMYHRIVLVHLIETTLPLQNQTLY